MTPVHSIPFKLTGYLPAVTQAYLDHDPDLLKLLPHRHEPASADTVLKQRENFPESSRLTLYQVLSEQYDFLTKEEKESSPVWRNILALKEKHTYTVTTGQQLQIFLGPLFFWYKIISAVKLAETLGQRYPGKTIVPVFWLASEDHDIAEIDHLELFNETYTWQHEGKGASGRLSCNGLPELCRQLSDRLGREVGTAEVMSVFENCYSESNTLAGATTRIIHHFFGNLGVVVLNADNRLLKSHFIPYICADIFENRNYPLVNASNKALKALGYPAQLNPREINFFYLLDNLRERIVFSDNQYRVLNTDIVFTAEDLEAEISAFPERFSPNAVLRPLYQEVILPNLSYVAGGSELHYWLELPEMFAVNDVPYPLPYLRNSLQYIGSKQLKLLEQFKIPITEMFKPEDELRQILIAHFSGQNPVSTFIKKSGENNEALLKALSELIPARLKEVKKKLDQELTSYKDMEAEVQELLLSKSETQISRFLKIKNEAFSPLTLQERRISCLQYLCVFSGFWVETSFSSIDTEPQSYKCISLN